VSHSASHSASHRGEVHGLCGMDCVDVVCGGEGEVLCALEFEPCGFDLGMRISCWWSGTVVGSGRCWTVPLC